MAQRVNTTMLRLGINTFWNSQWYSTKHYSSLFFEDLLIKFYFKSIFEKRGFYFKSCITKRTVYKTLIIYPLKSLPFSLLPLNQRGIIYLLKKIYL
jgi:hypothetical protein